MNHLFDLLTRQVCLLLENNVGREATEMMLHYRKLYKHHPGTSEELFMREQTKKMERYASTWRINIFAFLVLVILASSGLYYCEQNCSKMRKV